MTPPCVSSGAPAPERAVAATTAGRAGLPALPGISDTPTDPTCPGSRHGSIQAYRANGCCCPEVVAHVLADAERRRATRAATAATGERRRRSFEVDDGDVDAAVWAALRWRPFPTTLTQDERKAVVLRLRRAGAGWSGLMSALEIAERTGISDKTIGRYLEEQRLIADAVRAARQGKSVPAGLGRAVLRPVVVHLGRRHMPAADIAARTGVRPSVVELWLNQDRLDTARTASPVAVAA